MTVTMDQEEAVYCRWHPDVETSLRCYQCGAPICPKCAQRTPVGYLCPDCRKGTKRRFEQSQPTDYIIAAVASVILGGLAGWFLPMLGWYAIFLSPLSGTLIAEAVWALVGRRYGSKLWWIVAGGIILGGLPQIFFSLLALNLFGLLWPVVHLSMAVGASTARLRLR